MSQFSRFTRSSEGKFEVIPSGDVNVWKSKTFSKPVTKLNIYSDGTLGIPSPIIEIKLDGVDGSFIIGVTHEFDIENHVVHKVEYRNIVAENGLFSVLGLRPSTE